MSPVELRQQAIALEALGMYAGVDYLRKAADTIESLRTRLAEAEKIEDDRENLAERLESVYERLEAAQKVVEAARPFDDYSVQLTKAFENYDAATKGET